MPSNIDKLKDMLTGALGIKTRKSPLGINEYILPENLYNIISDKTLAFSTKGPGMNPFNVYRERTADIPETQTHERIHAGQVLLDNEPTDEQVINILGNQAIYGKPSREIPAYEFSNPYVPFKSLNYIKRSNKNNPKRDEFIQNYINLENLNKQHAQERFNNYIDLINSINPGQSQSLEAAMPDQLIREYIKSHPRPLVNRLPEGLR